MEERKPVKRLLEESKRNMMVEKLTGSLRWRGSAVIRQAGTPSGKQALQACRQAHPVPSTDKINIVPPGKGNGCKGP